MNDVLLSPEQTLKSLHWRYATKKFDPNKKIGESAWKTLEQSLVLSPSSFGLQPWRFLVIRNPEVRQKLLEFSWNQTPVIDASHLVVFAIKKDIDNTHVDQYIKRMAEIQQESTDKLQGFANMVKGFLQDPPFPLDVNNWSAQQTYIALGFFMNCAAMMGIDTLPMEGFVPAKYDEILHLGDQGYHSVVLCAAGYRAEDDPYAQKSKVRFPTEQVVEYID